MRLRELENSADPDFDIPVTQTKEQIVQERARKQRERQAAIKRQEVERFSLLLRCVCFCQGIREK